MTLGEGSTPLVQAPENEIGPPFQGNCTADNEVTLDDVLGDTATITVTNTFPTAPVGEAFSVT